MASTESLLKQLPSVDKCLRQPEWRNLQDKYPRHSVVSVLRDLLENLRREIRQDGLAVETLRAKTQDLASAAEARLLEWFTPSLKPVVNATGVILHTNAGRAPLSRKAARRMAELAVRYSNLECDLGTGRRGHRDVHFETRFQRLTGCQAAAIANNNAAALLLILNTLALGRAVLVSRGELIEIGGSFRLPAIMQRSGAILREVGTTNRTRIADYRESLDEEVGLILRAHPSNYRIIGFAGAPSRAELVALASEAGIPLVEDLGSGLLHPIEHPALRREPDVQSALTQGVDLVCFSGDKLLGGPQGGIMAGRKDLVDAIRRNPLMRACRVDKLTYAAMDATLEEYERGRAAESLPVYRMLLAPVEEVRSRAASLASKLSGFSGDIEVVDGDSLTGGGAAPEERIPTALLSVRPEGMSVAELERRLRANDPPILTRVEEGRLLLDLRTVRVEEEAPVVQALLAPRR